MIAIYGFLWKRLADYAKKYQSGQDAVDEFNTKIAEIQIEVFNDLSPYYQANELVRGVLECWVRYIQGQTDSAGVLSRPVVTGEKFARILSLGVLNEQGEYLFEMPKYSENEIAIASRIPQRRPNVANKIVPYVPLKNGAQVYPKVATKYAMYYLIYPKPASIAFTYVSTSDEDVMTFDSGNSTDLGWDENAANIILYKLLEKYGIGNREAWLTEYAKLGLNTSMGGQQQ